MDDIQSFFAKNAVLKNHSDSVTPKVMSFTKTPHGHSFHIEKSREKLLLPFCRADHVPATSAEKGPGEGIEKASNVVGSYLR